MSNTKRIIVGLSGNRGVTQALATRGMPRDILRTRPFKLDEYLTGIESDVEGLKAKRISRAKQEENYRTLYAHPQAKPYVAVIGSEPNDQKAKLCAAHLFERAVYEHSHGHVRQRNRSMPLWHTLTGSWADKLRDQYDRQPNDLKPTLPSFMVFSNITADCSVAKLEKLRDLLEIYSDVPRVIVITGGDGVTFANSRLHYPVSYAFLIATAKRVQI